MELFNRLLGIFFNPKLTLKAISKKPIWIDTLIILLVLLTIFSIIIYPYIQKGQLQAFKDDIQRQESMGEDAYNRQLNFFENPPQWYIILMTVVFPLVAHLIGFLLPSLIILGIGRMFSTEGNYKQIFSMYLHASIIDRILGNAVRLVLILIRKSVFQTTTSLALFFPRLEITSTAYKVLSQVDFFQLWFYGILAYGLSSVLKIDVKKSLIIAYGFWLLKTLFYIAGSFLFPQSMH
jgi:hypothetical protein